MLKIKSQKRKPQGTGIRNAYTFDQKLEIQRMKAKGCKYEKIKVEMNLPDMPKSTFYSIINTTLPDSHIQPNQYRRSRSDVQCSLNQKRERQAVDNLLAIKQDGHVHQDNGLYWPLMDAHKMQEFQVTVL